MWQLLGISRKIAKFGDFSTFFHAEGPSGVAVDPLQARSIPVPEKENVRTVLRTVTLSSKEGKSQILPQKNPISQPLNQIIEN